MSRHALKLNRFLPSYAYICLFEADQIKGCHEFGGKKGKELSTVASEDIYGPIYITSSFQCAAGQTFHSEE